MFKKAFITFAVLIGLIHPTYAAFESRPVSKSEEIRIQIEKNFGLKQALPKHELYRLAQIAISEANPRHLGLRDRDIVPLSREVVDTAQCYGVDPVVFISLIWRESNFKPHAQSERGAAGLTQMTRVGIKEVLERLSPVSRRRLTQLRQQVKQCSFQFYRRIPSEISGDTLAAWKNSVMLSRRDALVMGALLFKINLASSQPETRRGGKLGLYEEALKRYNGDPLVKVEFAQAVLARAKRMMDFPKVASVDSRFLSRIEGL
ncbi:MAG: transglycosylase SLT domain-containing protein [Bdellovibrionales bacterium]|nr:transglycosylase SLT domain-containing protein [Oligoflexia bacterium]